MNSNLHEKLVIHRQEIDAENMLRLLNEALEKRDGGLVDEVILMSHPAGGFSDKFSGIFCRLLQADWHYRHEDVARILQSTKDPATVDCLADAAELQFDYLGYDDTCGFARKCIWALADIGTFEAKAKLQQLAHSKNELIAEYAQKRLNHWEAEQPRKGASN